MDKMIAMLGRHLHIPHEFVIISDQKQTRVRYKQLGHRVMPLWTDLTELGRCFRRLKIFDKDLGMKIGPRFAWIDLDMVVTDDVTNIFTRQEDFVISGVELGPQPYNGSLVIMNAGARQQVWSEFDYQRFRRVKAQKRYGGTDQAWLAVCLGEKEATITEEDGLYCYRNHVAPRSEWFYESWSRRNKLTLPYEPTHGPMPEGCRLMQMNGPWNPSTPRVQRLSPWIKRHWK